MGAGLKSLATDIPLRSGYAQATAGYSVVSGPFARAEVGVRPAPGASVFAFGQWDRHEPMVGIGARWEWGW